MYFLDNFAALVGWMLKSTDALLKVTIVPRTNQILGFASYLPKDQKLYNQEEVDIYCKFYVLLSIMALM